MVYNNYLLHWGSNYSTKLRRIVHGTFGHFFYYPDAGIGDFLSPPSRAIFQSWVDRSEQVRDATESALRAVINRDAPGYRAALEGLHPGAGEYGKSLLTIFLSKATNQLKLLKRSDFDTLSEQVRKRATTPHPFALSWGEEFGRRFTPAEAEILAQRFRKLDATLGPTRAIRAGFPVATDALHLQPHAGWCGLRIVHRGLVLTTLQIGQLTTRSRESSCYGLSQIGADLSVIRPRTTTVPVQDYSFTHPELPTRGRVRLMAVIALQTRRAWR